MSFKNKGKILFRHTNDKTTHDQQTHTTRNVKEYPSDRKKTVSDGNMNLCKGMVNTWKNI